MRYRSIAMTACLAAVSCFQTGPGRLGTTAGDAAPAVLRGVQPAADARAPMPGVNVRISDSPSEAGDGPGTAFDLESTRSLYFTVSLERPLDGARLKLEVISPDHKVYETFEKRLGPVEARAPEIDRDAPYGVRDIEARAEHPARVMVHDGRASITWRLPLRGTPARALGMVGSWRVRVFVDHGAAPSATMDFILTRG